MANKPHTLKYKLLMLSATLMWGLSFVVMKDTVDVLGPNQIIGVRFFLCGLGLAAIFWKRMRACFNRDTIVRGIVLGVLLYLAYEAQTVGLTDTTPGKNAFLTATYCVMMPFMWWVAARRRPAAGNFIAAVMCIVGIGLVSLDGGLGMRFGDAMTLVAAFFFGVHMVFVALFTPGRDVYVLTVYQFITMGIIGLVLGAAFEPAPDLSAITGDVIFNMAYLTIFASGAALLFQNIGLAHVPPTQSSLILSLESVFGVLFSILLYGEAVTLRLIVGFALIFIAIVVSELKGSSNEQSTDLSGDISEQPVLAVDEQR